MLGGDAAGGAEDGSTSEPPTTPRRHTRPAGATLTYLNKIRHKLANDPAFFQSLHCNIIYPPHPLMSSSSENPSAFYLPKVLVFAPHASKRSGDTKCCPRCGGNKVYGDGWSQFRRIIDVNDCFFVIGQRYRCQARHPNNTFVAWDERLLRATPPHILALLPVILTRKLGVSQALMDLMRSLVDSGMGPFAEMIKENHTREHHRRELAYLSRLERLRPDPSTGQRTMSACRSPPPHFSLFSTQDGYNGCYGSLGYFRSVYVREMAKLEPRLKRHSAALPARVLSGDHFFKIIKCNFTFKGKRLFMAAYSLVNENTEVMAAVLTQSKSMDELRVLLEGVQRRLIAIGMPPAQVEVFYTDNPTAEAPFLESVYPGLSKSAVPLAGFGGRSSEAVLASRSELDFPADHYMEYVVNRDAAALAIDVFRRDLLDDARQRAVPPVMGLDAEWDISPGSSRRLQVLQLSSRTQTLVLHLSRMASIPHQLGALLVDPGVGKAGKMIAGDAAKLDAEWSLPVRGWFELGMYAKERKPIPNAGISLAALTEVLLDRTLNKSEQLRFGNWSAPLSNDAQRYAGLDAYASLAVYEAARTMRSATPGPNATVEGVRVFLTDTCGLRRVAICSVVRDSMNVAADAVKVRLEKVLLPGYVVPKIGLQPSRALRDIAADGASKGTKQVFAVSRRHLRDVAHPVEKRRTEDLRRGRLVRAALEERDETYDALGPLEEATRRVIRTGVVDGTGEEIPDGGVPDIDEQEDDVERSAADEDYLDIALTSGLESGYVPRGMLSGVRGDVMHAMDRVLRRVPKNHGATQMFARCLTHAMLVFNKGDADAARRVAAERIPALSWDEVLYRHSKWVQARVRRVVPPPGVLAARIQRVCRLFEPVQDASTKQLLLNAAGKRAVRQVVKMAADGWLSDLPGVGLYTLRGRDQDNLPLWPCSRGMNSNEGSVHQKLVKNFGNMSGASAELVHFALLEWIHRHNLRAAHNNRPDIHSIGHYDVWILEAILALQEEVYGQRVSYLSHQSASELDLPDFLCGVLPVAADATAGSGLPNGQLLDALRPVVMCLSPQKQWLAERMGLRLPLLPVHTLAERCCFLRCSGPCGWVGATRHRQWT